MEVERQLQKQIRRMQFCVAFLALAVLVLIGTAFSNSSSRGQVLRVRGIIVEDDQGRERILIGAPIPDAKNRVRTDLARVKQAWGQRFPSKYMSLYPSYRNDMNGILVLDSNGFDRLAIGDPVPDLNMGQRIAPATGVVINDENGFERTGYAVLRVEDRYRVMLGLDNNKGQEGATLSLTDGGPIGLELHDGSRRRTFVLEKEEKK